MKQVLCILLNPALDMTISVENLTIGKVNRAADAQLHAAGKALNAAQILSGLGVRCVLSGFLGDENQAAFERLFAVTNQQQTLLIDRLQRVAGQTRTNIKLVDKGLTTDINGQGFVVNEADKEQLLIEAKNLAEQCDAVLVAGSLPQGFALADFDKLLQVLCAANDKVAVDVSGDALKIALNHNLWLIKPNTDELLEAFAVPCDDISQQQAWLDSLPARPCHSVISMGEQGVNWFTSTHSCHAAPPKVTVKSTVGAGDTLLAGMIYGLLHEHDKVETLTTAVALAAHAVSIVGFAVADKSRLDALRSQVVIDCR